MLIPLPLNVGPETPLVVSYDAGVMKLPLQSVTAVSLQVTRADGTTATWPCTILGASASQIRFVHTWDAVNDCPSTGMYRCAPVFTVGGNPCPGNAFYLFVSAPSELRSDFSS
jgi:hypothetical protein